MSDHVEGVCGEGGGGDKKQREKVGLSGDSGVACREDSRAEGAEAGVFPLGCSGDRERFGEKDSGLGKRTRGVPAGDWMVEGPFGALV